MAGNVDRGALYAAGESDAVLAQDLGNFNHHAENVRQDGSRPGVAEESERSDNHCRLCRAICPDRVTRLPGVPCAYQYQSGCLEFVAHSLIGWGPLAVLCCRVNQG